MRERILAILTRQRRRLLAARAAEAAAVGGVAGGLTAAALMAARILLGRHPAGAAALCALPLIAGLIVAASRRARGALHAQPPVAWAAAAVLLGCGAGGIAAALAGLLEHVPKNWLILILPAGSLLPAVVAVASAASLGRVAMDVDRRADLGERLSTAWELLAREDDAPFAAAVQDQAIDQLARRDLKRVRFWNRTRATVGALGLAVLAAGLMLPWAPLETPEAARARRWQAVSRRAGESLTQPLAVLGGPFAAVDGKLAGQVRRLEDLARLLREGRAEHAAQWEGRVVELDTLAAALRRASQAEDTPPAVKRQLAELIEAVERASARIAAAMAEEPPAAPARGAAELAEAATRPAAGGPPAAWATVYHPGYVSATRPPTTGPAPGLVERPVPFDEAWAAARRRAAESLRGEGVPAEYRRLVRDFFAVEQ